MLDYEPIGLSAYCNAGTPFHTGADRPPLGHQTFHGLPFLIGSDQDCEACFIGFGQNGACEPVAVAIGTSAHTIIVAHALLKSRIDEGEPVGHHVADYVVRFVDGSAVRLPIRERFEINIVPTGWGHWPFLARPDQIDTLAPRDEGPWDKMGRRQVEALQGTAHAYYLWAWRNPDPDRAIDQFVIEPRDRQFLVAAVTLGHLDEPPFIRTARRAVRVSLAAPENGDCSSGLTVTVDRGVTT